MPVETSQTSKLNIFRPKVEAPRVGVGRFLRQASFAVLALLRRPGFAGDVSDKVSALRALASSVSASSALLASGIWKDADLDPEVLSDVEAKVAEWVAVKWVATGDASIRDEIDALLEVMPMDLVVTRTSALDTTQMPVLESAQMVLSELLYTFDRLEVKPVFEQIHEALFKRAAEGGECFGVRLVALSKIMVVCLGIESAEGRPNIPRVLSRWREACDVLDSIVSAQLAKAEKLTLQTKKGVGYDLGGGLA